MACVCNCGPSLSGSAGFGRMEDFAAFVTLIIDDVVLVVARLNSALVVFDRRS